MPSAVKDVEHHAQAHLLQNSGYIETLNFPTIFLQTFLLYCGLAAMHSFVPAWKVNLIYGYVYHGHFLTALPGVRKHPGDSCVP